MGAVRASRTVVPDRRSVYRSMAASLFRRRPPATGRGEALDMLLVVRVEKAGLIPYKADHGDTEPGLAQFLQQPITDAFGLSGGAWAAENM